MKLSLSPKPRLFVSWSFALSILLLVSVCNPAAKVQVQAHNEDTWDSTSSNVRIDLHNDHRTSVLIPLSQALCDDNADTDEDYLYCVLNITEYVVADVSSSCSLYNGSSFVQGDTFYDCKSAHRGRVQMQILNKYGCIMDPYERNMTNSTDTTDTDASEVVDVDAKNGNVTTASDNEEQQQQQRKVNRTKMLDVFTTMTAVAGHSCQIESIENVKIDGMAVDFDWEKDHSAAAALGVLPSKMSSIWWLKFSWVLAFLVL